MSPLPPDSAAPTPAPGPLWTPEKAELLQSLREAARLDEAVFAKDNALSLGQLQTLEMRGTTPFYSEQIKAQIGHRLLARLGHTEVVSQAGTPICDPAAASASDPTPVRWEDSIPVARGPAGGRGLARPVWALGLCVAVAGAAGLWISPRPATTARPQASPVATADRETAGSLSPSHAVHATLTETPRAAGPSTPCSPALRARARSHTPEEARKPATYVHLEALAAVRVCVVDSTDRVTELDLRAGQGYSVSGQPPFLVTTETPQSLRIFFQGLRVPAGETDSRGVLLQALTS